MAARPTEIRLVAGLLEEPAEDVEELAKRVIEALDEDRTKRPSYVFQVAAEGMAFDVGPFATRAAALSELKLAAPDTPDDQLKAAIYKVMPPRSMRLEVPKAGGQTRCPECGHFTHTHDWPKYKRKPRGCVVSLKPEGPVGKNLCTCTGDGMGTGQPMLAVAPV
jgi:hypothetical protein